MTRQTAGSRWRTTFQQLINDLPMHAAVIFVHYAPGQTHADVVTNSPHSSDEPVWIVNDLGPHNAELMPYARPRIPLAFL